MTKKIKYTVIEYFDLARFLRGVVLVKDENFVISKTSILNFYGFDAIAGDLLQQRYYIPHFVFVAFSNLTI